MPARKIDPDAAVEAYACGQTAAQIARRFDVAPPAVTRLLARYGVKVERRVMGARERALRKVLCEPLSEAELRRLAKQIDGTYYPPRQVEPPQQFENRACVRCGVRGDNHRLHGCRRWL